MKYITKRKEGFYMIRRTFHGITITKYASTLNEAKKIRTQLNNSHNINQVKTGTTLSSWIDQWLETYKKPFVKPATLEEIKKIISRVNKQFGKMKLNELNTFMIQDYLNHTTKSRLKEKTQIYLNAILQKAEDLSIIKKNPFKGVVRDRMLKSKNECFSYDQQCKILQAIKNTKIEKEIYIYLLTGCRPNELPKKENFDFENNLITINGTKTERAKKRVIEITQNFADYIKNYILEDKRITVKEITKEFGSICNQIGIDKPLIYRLRHTFATNHFSLKTPAKQVQEWLGHSKISLTLDIYTDIDKTATREKLEKLYNNFYYEMV